ncbi:MAG: biotin--[acetyl-CoA-carboxylase] ligase [Myxacorys californica WJT36-NPBG1]|nr:biotin--[acetyl-CoA-carboxylase] ligase [Myxacorys californica WJT36-NPBG1]
MPLSDAANWLHWLESCPSTNTWAMNASRHPNETAQIRLQHGDVVFTPQQTAGRGQHGRIWHSPPGVLTASIVLDRIPAVHLPQLSLAAGLAVIYAIEDLLPDLKNRLRLKWSNDVLFDGRKLAGILCEAISPLYNSEYNSEGTASRGMGRAIVGVGLNRCVEFEQAGLDASVVASEVREALISRAVSLHQISPIVPDEFLLLERLRHYLLQASELMRLEKRDAEDCPGLTALLPALRQRDALLGHFITVDLGNKQISGEAGGISDRGHLLLKCADGKVRSFVSGHILW